MSGEFLVEGVDAVLVKKINHDILKDFFGDKYIDELKKSYELNYNFEKNIRNVLIGMNINDAKTYLSELGIDFIDCNKGYQGIAVGAPLSKVVLYSNNNIISDVKMTTENMKEN